MSKMHVATEAFSHCRASSFFLPPHRLRSPTYSGGVDSTMRAYLRDESAPDVPCCELCGGTPKDCWGQQAISQRLYGLTKLISQRKRDAAFRRQRPLPAFTRKGRERRRERERAAKGDREKHRGRCSRHLLQGKRED